MKAVVALALAACGHVGFDPIPITDAPPDSVAPDSSGQQCVAAMSGAGGPACVLRIDGRIACWGANGRGELGIGHTESQLNPVLVEMISDAVGIGTGEWHTCAISRDTTASCWGQNERGQVGDGTVSQRLLPSKVYQLSGVSQILTGQSHSCARLSNGDISCWGSATLGAVGSLGTANVLVPTQVAGIAGATHLAVGDNITCVLRNDSAYCWGQELLLGDGSGTNRPTPGLVPLPPDRRVVDIVAGCHRHVCALLEDGTAWCWGENTLYQLGDGTRTLSRVPVQVKGGQQYKRISVGASHSCGLTADGTVWCWGSNASNQIDEAATTATAIQPRRILLPEPVEQVEAGCARTCARKEGRVWCWGDDALAVPTPRSIHEIAIPCPASL